MPQKRRFLLLPLLILCGAVLSCSAGARTARFSDVQSTDWYYDAVCAAADSQMVQGTERGEFQPQAPMCRGQFLTVLGRMAGVNPQDYGGGDGGFADVAPTEYYAPYICWGQAQGLVSGTAPGRFSPEEGISRQETATLLLRFVEKQGVSLAEQPPHAAYADAEEIAAYARAGVTWLSRWGILQGDPQGRVHPRQTLNRAEGVTLLLRLREALGAAGVVFPRVALPAPDLPAKPTMQEGLRVSGRHLVNAQGKAIQLRGVSTHGLSWYPEYVNRAAIRQLAEENGVNVLRLALYTEEYGGYCSGGDRTALKKLVCQGVDDATACGLYVILDWHILSDGDPNTHLAEAKEFFSEMATRYGAQNNVLYEICNEPNGGTDWPAIRRYAQALIPVIRAADPDSVILVGTPNWSQRVDLAAADPLAYDNILYVLHFYANTHKAELRNTLSAALEQGLPVFVSEFGLSEASGHGANNWQEGKLWLDLLDREKISYVAWSLSNKSESCALLRQDCSKTAQFVRGDYSDYALWLWERFRAAGQEDLPQPVPAAGTEPETPAAPVGTEDAVQGGTVLPCVLVVENRWQEGAETCYQLKGTVQNPQAQPVSQWQTRISLGGAAALVQGWNGSFSIQGETLTVASLDYNAALAPQGSVSFGCILRGQGLQFAARQ